MQCVKHSLVLKPAALFLLIGVGVLGCSDVPTAPQLDETQALEFAAGKAETMTSSIQIPVPPLEPFVPCANGGAGEVVVQEGTVHLVSQTTVNGDFVHVVLHANPQGVTGIGQETGDTYQGNGASHIVETSTSGLPYTFTFANTFNIIGPGPDNNYLQHDTIQTTINANGELTAEVLQSSVECR